MLNEDDLFLVSIFRRAYPFDLKPSAEKFLHHNNFEISSHLPGIEIIRAR